MPAKPKTLWWFWKDIFSTENLIPEQAAGPCRSAIPRLPLCKEAQDECLKKVAALAGWSKLKTMVMFELLQEGGTAPR